MHFQKYSNLKMFLITGAKCGNFANFTQNENATNRVKQNFKIYLKSTNMFASKVEKYWNIPENGIF